jgi:hypothetical protein
MMFADEKSKGIDVKLYDLLFGAQHGQATTASLASIPEIG